MVSAPEDSAHARREPSMATATARRRCRRSGRTRCPIAGIGAYGIGALNTIETCGRVEKDRRRVVRHQRRDLAPLRRSGRVAPMTSRATSRAASRKGSTGLPDTLYPWGGTAFDRQKALTSGSGSGLQESMASWKSPVSRVPLRKLAGGTDLDRHADADRPELRARPPSRRGGAESIEGTRQGERQPLGPALSRPVGTGRPAVALAGPHPRSTATSPRRGMRRPTGSPCENGPVWTTPPRPSRAPATTAERSMATPMAWRTTESLERRGLAR